MTITSALAFFVLMALATVIFFASKRFNTPYTVLLVLVGILLVPIVNLPYLREVFGFLDDMVLTPELLFYIFLPILIFESGFNINIRKMVDSAWSISLLAVVGLVISTVLVAVLLYYALPLVGFEIPFIVALLFGAIISPTDPVAVLALFKEVGAPKRLSMMFEGESLLNDGTAMALFFVILSVALEGYNGIETIGLGLLDFIVMIVMGILIGLVMAALFSQAIKLTRQNSFVTITLLLISAHLVFILTELINHSGYIHASSIIATTVAALFLGNYSRTTLPAHMDHYLDQLLEHLAFVANSLVFLMAGLLFASAGAKFFDLWLPIIVTVLVVAISRALSVYSVTLPLGLTKLEEKIPSSWQKLLAWGSLRGSLSIIIVLLIPENFTIEGWSHDYSPRDFLLALTIGCILATLFIKAPTIKPMMKKYNITRDEPLKNAHEADLGIYVLKTERSRLQRYLDRGYISKDHFDGLNQKIETSLQEAYQKRDDLIQKFGTGLFDQSLHLAMIHLEMTALKKLFMNEEMSEDTYRKIHSKLCLQQEKIEYACQDEIDPEVYTDRKDIFDRLVNAVYTPFKKVSAKESLWNQFEYYRAQMIIARKALQKIESIQKEFDGGTFLSDAYERVLKRYETYRLGNDVKMKDLLAKNQEHLLPHVHQLATCSLLAGGRAGVDYLYENGLVDEHNEDEIFELYTEKVKNK